MKDDTTLNVMLRSWLFTYRFQGASEGVQAAKTQLGLLLRLQSHCKGNQTRGGAQSRAGLRKGGPQSGAGLQTAAGL